MVGGSVSRGAEVTQGGAKQVQRQRCSYRDAEVLMWRVEVLSAEYGRC